MRGGNRLFTLIFGVFYLGFIGVFVSLVIRFAFGGDSSAPVAVASKATIIQREKENKISTKTVDGLSTSNTTTLYYLIGEYQDGEITRQGKYTVSEDVYFSHEEGSTLDIYYYPGMTFSSAKPLPPRSTRGSSTRGMTQIIGIFMLIVAGSMAFGFIGGILIPVFKGQKVKVLPRRSRAPSVSQLQDRFGDRPPNNKPKADLPPLPDDKRDADPPPLPDDKPRAEPHHWPDDKRYW